MAQSTIKNVMVELRSFDNDNLRIRIDNPKTNITRAEIADAFQTAFTNNWIITSKGSTAGYIGEVVLETSTKISLEGDDYYVTPNSLTLNGTVEQTLTITGAQVQGFNIKNFTSSGSPPLTPKNVNVIIAENGLSVAVAMSVSSYTGNFDLILIILGQEVTIPCTFTKN